MLLTKIIICFGQNYQVNNNIVLTPLLVIFRYLEIGEHSNASEMHSSFLSY